MLRLLQILVSCLVVIAMNCLPATAGASMHTRYVYYSVSGSSLSEIHAAMVRSGPTAHGVKGFGVTTASPGSGMSIASCKKSGGYHFDVSFVISLPNAGDVSGLSSTESTHFRNFTSFVKRHEETHRRIWMQTAAKYDRLLQAGGTKDCASAHAKAMTLWRQMVAESAPRQAAFDRVERSHLMAQTFIKLASR